MNGSLALEFIGCNAENQLRQFEALARVAGYEMDHDRPQRRGPAVAAISRSDSGKIIETQIYGRRDYSKANSKCSRGVFVHYILKPGTLYRVAEPRTWHRVDHYFAAVAPDGSIYRLSDEETQDWLSAL